MKLTKKALKSLKEVFVERSFNGITEEQMKKELIENIKRNNLNLDDLKEDCHFFYFGTRVFVKPKITRITTGKVIFQSVDYIFYDNNKDSSLKNGSFGNIKDIELTSEGWEVKTLKGETITYKIIEGN